MKHIKSLIVCALILLFYPPFSFANETVYVGAWSQHFFETSDYDYNGDHKLLAVEKNNWLVGYFENSFYEDTFTAGYHLKKRFGNWEPGAVLGASYGYRNCEKGRDKAAEQRRVCPIAAPSLTYYGINATTGIKPTVLVLGNAVAVTIGINTRTVAEKIKKLVK